MIGPPDCSPDSELGQDQFQKEAGLVFHRTDFSPIALERATRFLRI